MPDDQYSEILSDQDAEFLAKNLEPVNLSESKKASIWKSIERKISSECPAGGYTIPATEGEWFSFSDKIKIKVLHRDPSQGIQSALWRLEPGAVIECHQHTVDEECLVLEGQVRVGGHSLTTGDFHFMASGSDHPDIVSDDGALLFLKHQYEERPSAIG